MVPRGPDRRIPHQGDVQGPGSYSGASCNAGTGTCFDVNSGNLSSSVFMANAYLDLGTWWSLTPFIGADGGAYKTFSGVQDNGITSDGTVGFGYTLTDDSAWSLAWNVQAGLTYTSTTISRSISAGAI